MTNLIRRAFWALIVNAALSLTATGQIGRGSWEEPDFKEFGPPFEFVPKYEHEPQNRKLIKNADFFCTQCVKEGRLPFKNRADIKDKLEWTKPFPIEFQGQKERTYGLWRIAEHDADLVMNYVFKELKTEDPIYIEDKWFRQFTDFEGFNTKLEPMPRREIELDQLGDIFPEVTRKTVAINGHHRAHLYLIRAHRAKRDFELLIDYDAKAKELDFLGPYHGCREKYEIYIFDKREAKLGKVLQKFLGHSPQLDGECWHTLKDDGMCAFMHCENLHDFQLNNTFTHRLAFNFAQAYRSYQFDNPAWFQLGFGHFFERRERTDFNTFLLGEGRMPDLWGNTKWKVAVRKMVEKDEVRPFAEIAAFENISNIKPAERGPVWSMVSYLIQLDQKKFAKFYKTLKDKKQGESVFNLQVRAFQVGYGLSVTRFFDDWKAWVLATYPAM